VEKLTMSQVSPEAIQKMQDCVAQQRETIIEFMREICAIPSMEGKIGPVGERIAGEMRKAGFDEVRFDRMGNILGRIGSGPRKIVYDSHIDTVGVGDPSGWQWDPFEGKVENGILYARGAVDEKGSTPGMVYGLALARDFGWLDGWTAYYFGNMEESCDGIAPNSFVEVDPKIRPDYVVVGEPSELRVYRGHQGRVELKVVAKGRSAHAGKNYLGDNAIYKMATVVLAIRSLEPFIGFHPVLGHAHITVSDMRVKTPSINAVPDEATIYVDRRMTWGETREAAIEQVRMAVPQQYRDTVRVDELFYDEPSYTGFVFPVEKYFPAWVYDETCPIVQAGQAARRLVGLPEAATATWEVSTNGTYWAGKAQIPAIGFGPGDVSSAHTVDEHVPLAEVVKATEFYAVLPTLL
jgi:putative selenium metabolism hydrolase